MYKCLAHQVRAAFNHLRLEWVFNKPTLLPSAIQHFTVGFIIGSQDPIKYVGKLLPF